MNTKNNKQYRETELKLEQAALDLMKENDIDKITVRAVCEGAKVNRSTFYAHFLDIYDMFDKMETEMRKEIMKKYFDIGKNKFEVFSMNSFIPLFTHIRENQCFYKIVLQTRKDFPIKQGFEDLWNDIFKPRCSHSGIKSESEMMYCFVFFQAGFTMCLKKWVDDGCKESEQELAETISKCIPEFIKSK